MLLPKLAYRNLLGAGLRTWLNVGVLSFTYVLIIWHQGIFTGMYRQTSFDTIKDQIGGGQYWHKNYDPFDPLTLEDSHGPVPHELNPLIDSGEAAAVLIRQATIYPEGRVQSVRLNGIDPGQKVLGLPTEKLNDNRKILPVMIGKIMARRNSLNIGDLVTIRWRDAHGTFDATEGEVVQIMASNVPAVDAGQLWLPIERLREMTALPGEATLITLGQELHKQQRAGGWTFRTQEYLLEDIINMVRAKRIGGIILYAILLFLAMLAIFDTQVLAIFRRRKEIGMLMALGMTRGRVIILFTLEGMMNGILALAVGAVYGIPILYYTAKTGIPLPYSGEEWGIALTARLFPYYSAWLVGITVVIVMLTVTVVSYLPSRRISAMKPTDAIRGKLT